MSKPTTATTPSADVRSQTSQLVTSVAIQAKEPRHEVYQRIYTRLSFLYGIDLHQLPRTKGESLLTVAERHDHIDKVYALAYAEYLYLTAYEE